MEILNIISILLSLHGIVLSVILFLKKQANVRAKKLLSIMILALSLALIMQNTAHSLINYQNKQYAPFILFIFLFGPLFFFYVKALIYSNESKSAIMPHLIPFLIAVLIYIPLILLIQNPDIYPKIKLFISLISIIHIAVYLILSIIAVRQYSRSILNNFSDIEKLNINWLYFLSYIYIFAWLTFLVIRVFFPDPEYNIFFWLIICVIIYIIGIFTLKQPEIVLGKYKEELFEKTKDKKYRKSSLSENQMTEYLNIIKNKFEREKIYLDNEITLSSLSEKLSISTHHLSQIINEKFMKNFYDLINTYRIQEAKEKLKDSNNSGLTILDIALETGFNSLSTFNAAFKKNTGMAPSAFRSKNNQA
jgi:AraC-like DNA-binding protein